MKLPKFSITLNSITSLSRDGVISRLRIYSIPISRRRFCTVVNRITGIPSPLVLKDTSILVSIKRRGTSLSPKKVSPLLTFKLSTEQKTWNISLAFERSKWSYSMLITYKMLLHWRTWSPKYYRRLNTKEFGEHGHQSIIGD